MAAAAPKSPEPMQAESPAPTPPAPRVQAEPLVPLSRLSIPMQPGPRFNDIMTAVLYRDPETVSQLLSLGRWPDRRDSNGLTPLMVAAGSGDAAMVKLLLERGANPDLQAPGGATALEFALDRGDAPTTQLLQRRLPR
jgi:ankyrin repeat protein